MKKSQDMSVQENREAMAGLLKQAEAWERKAIHYGCNL